MFKYRLSSRDESIWIVGCGDCQRSVKLIHNGGGIFDVFRCNCREWSRDEVLEAHMELE